MMMSPKAPPVWLHEQTSSLKCSAQTDNKVTDAVQVCKKHVLKTIMHISFVNNCIRWTKTNKTQEGWLFAESALCYCMWPADLRGRGVNPRHRRRVRNLNFYNKIKLPPGASDRLIYNTKGKMNRCFSKDGIFCPLTGFRWLPRSSKFRWRKWVSPQKVNINGDLLESEKENVTSLDFSQYESTWPTSSEVAASEAALRGTLGWRQWALPQLTLLPSAGSLDHRTTLTQCINLVHVISLKAGID